MNDVKSFRMERYRKHFPNGQYALRAFRRMMHAESGSRVFEMDDHLSRLGGHVRYRLSQQATKAITRWSPDKVATLTSSEPTLSSGCP